MVEGTRRLWEADAADESTTDQDRAGLLEKAFVQVSIIGLALAEGWGLFGSTAAMITGRQEFLAAPAIAAALLALQWPTQEKMERFVRQVTGEEE